MFLFKQLAFAFIFVISIQFGYAQKEHLSSMKGETTIGVGIGLPYGAFGLRFGNNLTNGLNLFWGLGYQISGIGYNVGLLKDFRSSSMTQFYLLGMYGTNAVIKIEGFSEHDNVYRGATFGLGIKINSRNKEGNYWDIGLLVPIRSSKFKDAHTAMKNDPRISEITDPWPVLFAVGYNSHLKKKINSLKKSYITQPIGNFAQSQNTNQKTTDSHNVRHNRLCIKKLN